mgnify:CR=1 FL=1
MKYVEPPYTSGSNGRGGAATGSGGYSNNSQSLFNGTEDVNVPLYVIPNSSGYYWKDKDQIENGTAKEITGVDETRRMLKDPTIKQAGLLSSFRYQKNIAVVHTDEDVMQKVKHN